VRAPFVPRVRRRCQTEANAVASAERGSSFEDGPPVAVLTHGEDGVVRARQHNCWQVDFLSRAERRVPEIPHPRVEPEVLAADWTHAMECGRPQERSLVGGQGVESDTVQIHSGSM
jgi:hypothetical protein